MNTTSLWRETVQQTQTYPELTNHLDVDVLIIGAGITGLTAALELAKNKINVAVVEKNWVGSGTTGDSTGNLYVPVQPYYHEVAEKFDTEIAKTVAFSRQLAMDYIDKSVQINQINCHFMRRPWYAFAKTKKGLSILNKETNLLKEFGFPIQETQNLPFNFKFTEAVILPNQARIHPLLYTIGLANKLHQLKVPLYESTPVVSIEKYKSISKVKTPQTTINAKSVFLATHTPIGIHTTQFYIAPYRSYVVATELSDNHYPEAHLWDLDEPKYAICTHPITHTEPQLLLVAGNHHKTGQYHSSTSPFDPLSNYLQQNFSISKIKAEWSAQHYQSADTLPYIGPIGHFAKNIYIATGFFADGLVYGTLAGMIMGKLLGTSDQEIKNHKWYDASRSKFIKSAAFLMSENLNVLLQYYKDLPLLAKPSYSELKAGEGKVVEINREKCAIARDDQNVLHAVSAVCTHMKCIVNWNAAEKTWDCPCHGSRFSIDGAVLEGPAEIALHKVKIDHH